MAQQTQVLPDGHMDPYPPREMAGRASNTGVVKTNMSRSNTFALAVLAGAFVAVGAEFATIVTTDSTLGYGPSRLLAGLVFSVGLILVVIAGAELFTGNTLIVIASLQGRVRVRSMLLNWLIVYAGNLVGSLATVAMVYVGRVWTFDGMKVGANALNIASNKSSLGFEQAIALGILCNALVCLAVWLCFSARSTTDKLLAIVPPIAAFVASGFEHSIANMYFIPMGILLANEPAVVAMTQATYGAGLNLSVLNWGQFALGNLLPVTIGNIIGGSGLVGLIYWFVYLRGSTLRSAPGRPMPSSGLRARGG
jgi:formate transporter